jgi:capsular exopolysaccharide synthesis family protein
LPPTTQPRAGKQTEDTGLDYTAILRGMWRRHKLLMGSIFVAVAIPAVAGVYLTSRPTYVSTATISIESSTLLDQLSGLGMVNPGTRRDTVAAHLVLLESRSLGEAVVDALPRESLEELLAYPQYTDYYLKATNATKQWLGKAPTVLSPRERAVAELQNARMEFTQSREAPGVVTIKATARHQRVAMDLVNTYVQVLLGRTRTTNQEEARKSREFLENQLQQARQGLAQAEEMLTRFEQQKGRIKLGNQTDLDLMKLSQVESTLAEAQASEQVVAARIANVQKALDQVRARDTKAAGEVQGSARGVSPTPSSEDELQSRLTSFRAAQDNLARLEAKLAAMRERYTQAYPLLQTTQEEVADARAKVTQLARELPAAPAAGDRALQQIAALPGSDRADLQRQLAALETEQSGLQARTENLRSQADRLRRSLRTLGQEELELTNLRRTVEANRNLANTLSDKLMGARIREQGESSVIRIIDPASYPPQPSASKVQKLVLMALAAAGGLAFGAAFGMELWKQPIETESDLEKTVSVPVLGSVGALVEPMPRRKHRNERPVVLACHETLLDRHAEAYRGIRTNIEAEKLQQPFRSILVTSPGPAEGKSTTLLNLAHAFQDFGRRVLIIDGDLRRPSIHRALGIQARRGTSDLIAGTATFDEVSHRLPSGLTVVPAHPTDDSSSLLGLDRLSHSIRNVAEQFDIILIDSPPVLAVSDSLVMATGLDSVLLVVRGRKTSRRDLRKAKRALDRTRARIVGVILNEADPRDVDYYRPRYQKYYRSEKQQPAGSGQRAAGSVRRKSIESVASVESIEGNKTDKTL